MLRLDGEVPLWLVRKNTLYSIALGALILWTLLSVVAIILYVSLIEWIWPAWYYIIWPSCAGGILYMYGARIKVCVVNFKLHSAIKYVLLVYMMVIIEETLASTVNHLSEGYSPALHIQRIGQFWAFNILAFSGLAWGSYLVFSRIRFSLVEMFTFFGLFGLIYEGLLYKVFFVSDQSIAALALVPLNFWVYGLIFLPALFVVEDKKRKNMRYIQRFSLVLASIVLFTLPFSIILEHSRELYPDLYPPRHMIP